VGILDWEDEDHDILVRTELEVTLGDAVEEDWEVVKTCELEDGSRVEAEDNEVLDRSLVDGPPGGMIDDDWEVVEICELEDDSRVEAEDDEVLTRSVVDSLFDDTTDEDWEAVELRELEDASRVEAPVLPMFDCVVLLVDDSLVESRLMILTETREEASAMTLESEVVTLSLVDAICEELLEPVLLSFIELVESPFSPTSSPSSLPFVSSGSPSSVASTPSSLPLASSVPSAAFENPIEELVAAEETTRVDDAEGLELIDVIPVAVDELAVDVADATVSRSMVEATLPVA
jgi:hypothetical protein